MLEKSITRTLNRWAERLFLFFLALYLLKSAEYMTTFNLSPFVPAWADRFLLIALLISTILKLTLLLLLDQETRTKWGRLILCALLVSLLWFLVYLNDKYIFLAFFSIMVLGCIGTDYKTLLKVQVCVVGAVVFSAAICCMGGAIENRIYWGHDTIRSSFGYTYPTNMAAYYVYLSIAAWIAWDEVWDPVFLMPGFLSLLISGVIADSKTSFLCSVLFLLMVIWCWISRIRENDRGILRLQKVFGIICKIAFPLCGFTAILLTIAFHQGLPFMSKMNDWTSNRLAQQTDAFYEYGIHLFGHAFEMRGLTSVYPVLNYNYVDCSYMQLLLRCGVLVFLAYMILWPFMTHTALKSGKYRLSMGLALIALHSLSEHRFLVADYNILFIAPFSVLSLGFFPNQISPGFSSEKEKLSGHHFAVVLTSAIILLLVFFFWRPILSGFRTLWTIVLSPNLTLQLYQRRSIFFASICFLYASAVAICLTYRIILSFLQKEKPKICHVVLLLLFISIGSLALIKGNKRIDKALDEYNSFLEEDEAVVSLVKKVGDLQIYEVELPMLYERKYGKICTSFYNGEDLARLHNLAVITDSDNHWPSMFLSGFSYAEITNLHAVYTDSPELIEKMVEAGYDPVPYYSKEMTVNMDNLAEWNRIAPKSDGSLVITREQPILNVPDVDLRAGNYTFCFELSLIEPTDREKRKAEDTAFMIGFSDNAGARQLFKRAVAFGEFDKEGKLDLQVNSYFNAAGVEFAIVPEQGVLLALQNVRYRITS